MESQNQYILDLFGKIEIWTIVSYVICALILALLPRRANFKKKDTTLSKEEVEKEYLRSSTRRRRYMISFIKTLVTFIVVATNYVVERIYNDGGDIFFVLIMLFFLWNDQNAYFQSRKLSQNVDPS